MTMNDRNYCERHFGRNEVIFREGDEATDAYVIESGCVEISASDGERSVVLATLGENSVFGEMAVIDGGVRSATAIAKEATRVIAMPASLIKEHLSGADPVMSFMVTLMTERFRRLIGSSLSVSKIGGGDSPVSAAECADQRGGILHKLRTAHDLQAALRRDELSLYFQPITVMRDGRLGGFEALVRWCHPERGWIPPSAFIPDAEDSGVIAELGYWVMREACRAISRIRGEGEAFVSVNVSAKQFEDRDLLRRVPEILEDEGVNPDQVKLELTESVLMRDPQTAERVLNGFKDMGFSIAMDDFGTGYSSLGYLHRFPVDTLKIDRSITNDICANERGARLVEAIIAMARHLSLKIVAEGVETIDQWRWLRRAGCHYEQGYRVGAPMPEDEALHLYNRLSHAALEMPPEEADDEAVSSMQFDPG